MINTKYEEFIKTKMAFTYGEGIDIPLQKLNKSLFDFQKPIVYWALKRGRSAVFADTGLGKTVIQVEWAKHVQKHTGGIVLILAPLCVGIQTIKEAQKLNVEIIFAREQPSNPGIYISNYEMMEHFDFSEIAGLVLDESSILKGVASKTRKYLIKSTREIKYKLSCTATPSPNDFMEFGGQSEFIGVMTTPEMLATYFIHDGGDTAKWRLKGHGKTKFYEWLSTWAVVIKKPSDIGFDDKGYDLPQPLFNEHIVVSDTPSEGMLFPMQAETLSERITARRESAPERVAKCAEIVNSNDEQWVVWCHLNYESQALEKLINGGVAVEGSRSVSEKEKRINAFGNKTARVIITKPSIAGFGLNWQHCRNIAFVGMNDSYEQFYQALRRCWRFGQKKQVNVHIISADTEGAVLSNIKRKEGQSVELQTQIMSHMRSFTKKEVLGMTQQKSEYTRKHKSGDDWDVYLADCVDLTKEIESNSIGYSIFSPPFSSLYTYSNSDRDMGNCTGDIDFFKHFRFLVDQLYRVIMPGRSVSFHCMDLPTSKQNHGFIGLRDFRGDLIRLFEEYGFILHSQVVIWKNPVTAMQRTKALGLLHKTIRKDSSMSRMGIPDYVVTMRKPGENPVPISHDPEAFPVSLWQEYASPVWMDINPSNTLNKNGAREDDDERHIAPLQLEVIERCMMLWSAPYDLVFSPFAGIGSEGYVAIKMGRRFIGAELKESYWRLAVKNIAAAKTTQTDIFGDANAQSNS